MHKIERFNWLILTILSISVFLGLFSNTSYLFETSNFPHYWFDLTRIFSKVFSRSNSLEAICVFFLLIIFSNKLFIPITNWKGYLLSLLFTVIYILCDNYPIFAKNQLFKLSSIFVVVLLLKTSCLSYLIYCLADHSIAYLRNLKLEIKSIEVSNITFIFYTSLIIFLCWLPIFIVYLPGTASFDALWQIALGTNLLPPTDHHPWPSTWLFARLTDLFNLKGSNFFLFPVSCFIYLTSVLIFALSCLYWKKILNIYFQDNAFIWLAPLFFALVPIYPNYGQTIIKDGIYSSAICLFYSAFVFYILTYEEKEKKKTFWILLISSLTALCFRHNGAYIIIPTLLIVILLQYLSGRKIKILFILLCLLTVFQLSYKLMFLPYFDIKKGSVVETLSLPAQTLAYILKENKYLSKEEEEKALKFFTTTEGVRTGFKEEISDNIKQFIRLPLSKDHITSFISLCLSHKGACVRGFLAQTYLYFYPNRLSTQMPVVYNFNLTFESVAQLTNGFKSPAPVSYFFSDKIRRPIQYWTEFWIYTFPFSFFILPAFSAWLIYAFVTAVLLLGRKADWYALCLIPIFVLGINLLSPVNGDTRYALPSIAFEPILFLLLFILIKRPQRLRSSF